MAITNNLEAFWEFEESSGNAADSTGNGWTGTASNVSYSQTGKVSNCFGYDGTGDKVVFGDLNITGNFTIQAWYFLNTTQVREWPCIISKGTDGAENYEILFNRTSPEMFCSLKWSTSGRKSISTTAVNKNQWQHVIQRFDGTNWEIWIDGVKKTTTGAYSGQTPVATTGGSGIGYDEAWGSVLSFFTGRIDEVGIWSRAITDSEIAELYNSGNGLAYPFTTGTNLQLNIADAWKEVSALQINIGDAWKAVDGAQINIGDAWKSIY